MKERTEINKAISVLEAQRTLLGDETVDAALAPLRKRLLDTEQSQSDASASLPGERKLITILFADVVGSTSIGGRLNAETSRLIMNRCLQRMSEAVNEFGGTVAQLLGDGLLAFFGAPRANEDDPERAALTAIQMHKKVAELAVELTQPIQIRVGINTGRVAVGEVGGDVHSEYLAMGQPVNLAARLESAAEPGHTLLGESTARMVRHRFQIEAAEPLSLKGFAEPIEAFALLAEHTDYDEPRGITGRTSALVGRDVELGRMNEMIARLDQGQGGIAALIGEPGIGKSRLLLEVKETQKNGRIQFAEGRAYSYTQGQPFSVVLDMLAELLDLAADDSPAIMDLKLEVALSQLFDGELETVWPFLSTLVGAPVPHQYAAALSGLDPEAISAKVIQAVQILIERIAERRPLVLSFEDLHWADGGSMKLIEMLMMSTEHFPVFLILLFRPDHDRPVWQLKFAADMHFAHRYIELTLTPLDVDESTQMISNLLEETDIPSDLQDMLGEQAHGNPLYVEELLRSLIESNLLVRKRESWQLLGQSAELEVPETLEKVIQARLDRLQPAERTTLQTASVIGRRFSYSVLEGMVSADGQLRNHLMRLQQVGMIRERSRLPEPEYIFKHVILQQVTYSTMLDQKRRHLHLRAAQTLEEQFAERREEFAPTLAEHYACAGENRKAIEFFVLAAGRAEEVYAFEEALQFLKKAETLSESQITHPEEKMNLLEHLANIHLLVEDVLDAFEIFIRVLELQLDLVDSDKWTTVRLHRKISESWWKLPREDKERLEARALASLNAGLSLTEGEAPHLDTVRLLIMVSHYARAARSEEWRTSVEEWKTENEYAQMAIEMAEQLDAPVELSSALHALGMNYSLDERFRESLIIAQRRQQLSHDSRFDDMREKLDILIETALALKMVGDYAQAIALLLESEQLGEKIRDISERARALWLQAECWTRLDRWDEVLLAEEKVQDLQRRYPLKRLGPICWLLSFSASVHILRGNEKKGARMADESYTIMADSLFLGAKGKKYWSSDQYY